MASPYPCSVANLVLKQSAVEIPSALHYPSVADERSEIQMAMAQTVKRWFDRLGNDRNETLVRLTKESVKTSASAPMVMPSCIPMPLVLPLTAPVTDFHTPHLTPAVLDIIRNLKVDANRFKQVMVLPKEEPGARMTPTRTRLHSTGDKSRHQDTVDLSRRRDMVDPSKVKDIVSRKLPDMANKRLAMDAKRSPLVDKGGPVTDARRKLVVGKGRQVTVVRRSARLCLLAKRKDMVARSKMPMADLLDTKSSPVTCMGSKNELDMVDAVIMEALDISLVDTKNSQAMDRAVPEVPVAVDVPKRWSMVRLAMEAPAVLDAVKNMDKQVADTEAEALSGTMMSIA